MNARDEQRRANDEERKHLISTYFDNFSFHQIEKKKKGKQFSYNAVELVVIFIVIIISSSKNERKMTNKKQQQVI